MSIVPEPGNERLIDTLLSLLSEAKANHADIANKGRWKDCETAYAMKTYADVPHAEWMSMADAPVSWEAIERTVPILTDVKPKLTVTGRGPEDGYVAKNLQVGADREMDRQEVLLLFPRVLREACKIGTSFMLTRVTMRGTTVRLKTDYVSAWNTFADPSAVTDEDVQYIFTRRPTRLSKLILEYPHLAEQIIAQASGVNGPGDARTRAVESTNETSPTPTWGNTTASVGGTEVMEITRGGGRWKATQFVDLWEFYCTDGDQLDVEIELADGTTEIVPEEKYPGGRIITFIGDLIIDDIPNPFAHGMIPLTRVVCYDSTNRYYGQSFIEAMLDTQAIVSRVDNKTMDWLALACDPERVVDEDAGVDTEHDFSAPSKVVLVKPGSRYEWRDPPQMPGYLWDFRAAKVSERDNAIGINEISRGNLNTLEDVSGKAIDAANEPNQQRTRLIQRNFEAAVSRWGKQTVANMIQFYPAEVWFRMLPPGTTILGWEEWAIEDLREWPDVVMTAGSSLPVNKAARRNEAIMFYREGLFGEPGSPEAAQLVFDMVDFPDKDKALAAVAKSYQMKQQMMMQQAMMAQAPGVAPGSGVKDKALGGEPDPEEDFREQVRIEGEDRRPQPAGFVG